jgi:hypothetical protein
MEISYIITISPILELNYLDILIQSLNLQTSRRFNVIFYNQTLVDQDKMLESLEVKPDFEYRFFNVDKRYFYGKYPIWDLYALHKEIIEQDIVSDYFMSLHMEEFLDTDYTLNILKVLEEHRFDILFGNLYSTPFSQTDVAGLLGISDSNAFNAYLRQHIEKRAVKWGLPRWRKMISKSPKRTLGNIQKHMTMSLKKQLAPSPDGYTYLPRYDLEDIFVMSKSFAKAYRWYDPPINLYFEDIHINSGLKDILKKTTAFPVYFNKNKVYHLIHRKYYYQLEDKAFCDGILNLKTDNPILNNLIETIKLMHTNRQITLQRAIQLTRRNNTNTGSANINVKFHKRVLSSKP